MAEKLTLSAEIRETVGKGASRRLRRKEDKIPAIIYGGDEAPKMITLDHKEILKKFEFESYFSQIITIKMDDNFEEEVLVKDLQRHPARNFYTHVDFQRIVRGQTMNVWVQLHFINEETCIGVKEQGGVINRVITEVEVSCLPKDIPEYIEVDMQNIEKGGMVHISDLAFPEGVTSIDLSHGEDHDLAVATVITPRGISEDEAEDTENAEDAETGDSEEGKAEE